MPDTTTLNETVRSPVDGTETIRLATTGANWRAPIGNIPTVFGGTTASSTLTLEGTNGAGTSDAIIFKTGSEVEAARFDTGGRFILCSGGTTNQAIGAFSAPEFQLHGTGASTSSPAFIRWNNGSGGPTFISGHSGSSTIGTLGAISAGWNLGAFTFYGDTGAAFQTAASIGVTADSGGTISTTSMPGRLAFFTTPNSSTALVQRLTIDMAGNTYVTTGTLGYGNTGTATGGTVTQATSRTTGVTLNTVCGQITMFSAAGSATAASFTVTNSFVAAVDTIILNTASATNLYLLDVTNVSAGSFQITFRTSGGTATDAPVINFAIFKSANT